MIWKYTLVLATSLFVASCQSKDSSPKTNPLLTAADSNFITGDWTYRSLLNNPVDTVQFNNLAFAAAIMQLKRLPNDSISGKLDMGSSGTLTIRGFIHFLPDGTGQFVLQGVGVPATNTQGWIYDYKGFTVNKWEAGVNQKDVLVGSLMRAANHGNSKAGLVASFYMVRRE